MSVQHVTVVPKRLYNMDVVFMQGEGGKKKRRGVRGEKHPVLSSAPAQNF